MPRVFGSVARGDDGYTSDLDLLVEFTDRHDIVDLLALQEDLREVLTVPVDLVDARGDGDAIERARAEAVALTGADAGRVERFLADLAAFGGDAVYTVGLGLDAYLAAGSAGRVLRNNGRQILVQVATVVEKLPAAFKAAHDDVDWVAIGRMCNLIAHHYDRVDDRLVTMS